MELEFFIGEKGGQSEDQVKIKNVKFGVFDYKLLNYPSGNPEPSINDIQLTRELVCARKVLKVKLQDHLIIGNDRYYSFSEQGKIRELEKQ